jgi:hypothetical protein
VWEFKGIKRELQEDIPCLFMKNMSNIRNAQILGNEKGIFKHKRLDVANNEILRFTNKDLVIYLGRYWEKLNVSCLIDKNLEMLLTTGEEGLPP